MIELSKIYKVWWEIDDPSLLFPVLGFRDSVQLSENRLSVKFPSHPAIQIIKRKKRFRVHPEYQATIMLSCRINEKGMGNLIEYFKYSIKIEKQNPCTTNAICFVSPENSSGDAKIIQRVSSVKIVDKVNPNSLLSISIDEGGMVTASKDLYGINVTCKIPVSFTDATEETTDSFTTVTSHIVGIQDAKMYYLKHKSGILNSDLSSSLHLEGWKSCEAQIL